jgi:hypothetical protein
MRKYIYLLILLCAIVFSSGCVTEFIPLTGVDPKFYVVEGLITDQPEVYTIKISRSIPLGDKADFEPVLNCRVWINDGSSTEYHLTTGSNGTYHTPPGFRGEAGRRYQLNIEIIEKRTTYPYSSYVLHTIRSHPVWMIPVPDIDSLYYEKVELTAEDGYDYPGEGCNVYLNTSDPTDSCRYYRWNYTETWKVLAPNFQRSINRLCWNTNESEEIILKTVEGLNENRIDRLPVKFITNQTDRLIERYRMEVNQFSVGEDEFKYWSNLEKIMEQTGGLYDKIPAPISGNLYCADDPELQILGYFSASSQKTRTIYIDEYFKRQVDPYALCAKDTLFPSDGPFPPGGFLDADGKYYWVLELHQNEDTPHFLIVTTNKACADCTVNGSAIKPDDWEDIK